MDWTVALDNETRVANALLRWIGNPPVSVKVNAGLTVFLKAWNADPKGGLSELWYPLLMGVQAVKKVTLEVTDSSPVSVHSDRAV